jgi:molybdopterin synthase catalytic subunit/molybdopterin converting factor small subunit
MDVTVRVFGALRERAGASQVALTLPDGACVRDALDALADVATELPLVLAVNREYATADTVLRPGDELAAVPPVSGGSAAVHVQVMDERLSLESLATFVRRPDAGAVVVFAGMPRDVAALEYDGYREMAAQHMRAIASSVVEQHQLCAAAIEHRVGVVPVSEASVVVAASARHRDAAFAGARALIDRVKESAPIWKCEEGRWKHETVPTTTDPSNTSSQVTLDTMTPPKLHLASSSRWADKNSSADHRGWPRTEGTPGA